MIIGYGRWRVPLAIVGFLLFPVLDLVHTYLLMPFPGSMGLDSVPVSYALERVLPLARLVGVALLLPALVVGLARGGAWAKAGSILVALGSLGAGWFTTTNSSASRRP